MKKALIVGINNYPDAPLKGCIRDATDLSALLEINGDGTANFDVLLRTDVPRKSTLRSLIADLFSGAADTALFYFSGHGLVNAWGSFLVTPDHRPHDEGISMNEILTLANNSSIKNRIIILDCCHSGAIATPERAHGYIGDVSEGVTLLTASSKNEAAMEENGKGVFTNLLLDALNGGAADLRGHITPGSIYAYIDQALGAWNQRPIFKTNVSRFLPLRTVAPKLLPSVLRRITAYFPDSRTEFPLDPSFEYTNDPMQEPVTAPPFADKEHVAVFKELQQMQSAGLVTPVDEEHMYWAAMNNRSCRLTPLGEHYRRLVKDKKI